MGFGSRVFASLFGAPLLGRQTPATDGIQHRPRPRPPSAVLCSADIIEPQATHC